MGSPVKGHLTSTGYVGFINRKKNYTKVGKKNNSSDNLSPINVNGIRREILVNEGHVRNMSTIS